MRSLDAIHLATTVVVDAGVAGYGVEAIVRVSVSGQPFREVADGLAELQARWPNVPIVFCETRKLAEEWTYRYLAAAHAWASGEQAAIARIGAPTLVERPQRDGTGPTPAESRAWARARSTWTR